MYYQVASYIGDKRLEQAKQKQQQISQELTQLKSEYKEKLKEFKKLEADLETERTTRIKKLSANLNEQGTASVNPKNSQLITKNSLVKEQGILEKYNPLRAELIELKKQIKLKKSELESADLAIKAIEITKEKIELSKNNDTPRKTRYNQKLRTALEENQEQLTKTKN